jgi:hypothetical protein
MSIPPEKAKDIEYVVDDDSIVDCNWDFFEGCNRAIGLTKIR